MSYIPVSGQTISITSTNTSPTIFDIANKQALAIQQLEYKITVMTLYFEEKISNDERRSLMKQLNSVDPEAVVLAQTTINNLMKKL